MKDGYYSSQDNNWLDCGWEMPEQKIRKKYGNRLRLDVPKNYESIRTSLVVRSLTLFIPHWCLLNSSKTLYPKYKPRLNNHEWEQIDAGSFASMQHQYLNPCQQLQVFRNGLPSKHCPVPVLLNFSVQMWAGVFNMARPLAALMLLMLRQLVYLLAVPNS